MLWAAGQPASGAASHLAVIVGDSHNCLLLPARQCRVDRAGQGEGERLVPLHQRVAHDGYGDGLCGFARLKRDRAAGGGVVGRRGGGAIGSCVADGDGLPLCLGGRWGVDDRWPRQLTVRQ
jgi:hypothetical protein